MKKRIFSIVLALVMLVSLLPVTAFADVTEPIAVSTLAELQTQISNAEDGSTIQLTANYTAQQGDTILSTIPADKTLTIDLNGKCLDLNEIEGALFNIGEGAELTLKNGTIQNGKVTTSIKVPFINLSAGSTLNCDEVTFKNSYISNFITDYNAAHDYTDSYNSMITVAEGATLDCDKTTFDGITVDMGDYHVSSYNNLITAKETSNVTITNSEFTNCEIINHVGGNYARWYYVNATGNSTLIENCKFYGNTFHHLGYIFKTESTEENSSSLTFKESQIYNNSCDIDVRETAVFYPGDYYGYKEDEAKVELIIEDSTINCDLENIIAGYAKNVQLKGECTLTNRNGAAPIDLSADLYYDFLDDNACGCLDISQLTNPEEINFLLQGYFRYLVEKNPEFIDSEDFSQYFEESYTLLSGLPTGAQAPTITINGDTSPYTCYQDGDKLIAQLIDMEYTYDGTDITVNADLDNDNIEYKWYSVNYGTIALDGDNTFDNVVELAPTVFALPPQMDPEVTLTSRLGTYGLTEYDSVEEEWTNLKPIRVGYMTDSLMMDPSLAEALPGCEYEVTPYYVNAVLAGEFGEGAAFSVKAAGLPDGAKVYLLDVASFLMGMQKGTLGDIILGAIAGEGPLGAYKEALGQLVLPTLMDMLTSFGATALTPNELTYDEVTGLYETTVATAGNYILVVDAGGENEALTDTSFSEATSMGFDVANKTLLEETSAALTPETKEEDQWYFCEVNYPANYTGTLVAKKTTDFVMVPGTTVTTVGTWAELQDAITAAEDGATIQLSGDITAAAGDKPFTIPEDTAITIDLNGKKLDRNEIQTDGGGVFTVKDGASLTLKNGTIANAKLAMFLATTSVIGVGEGAVLTCNGVTFTGNDSDTYMFIGAVDAEAVQLKDCVFTENYTRYRGKYRCSLLYIENSPFTIEGCTFTDNDCYTDPTNDDQLGYVLFLTDLDTEHEHVIKDCTITDNFESANDMYVIYNGCADLQLVGECVMTDAEGKTPIALAFQVFDENNDDEPVLAEPFMGSLDISGLTHKNVSLPHFVLDDGNFSETKYNVSALPVESDPFEGEYKILSGIPTEPVITIDGNLSPFTCYQVDDDIMIKVVEPSISYNNTTVAADPGLEIDGVTYEWHSVQKETTAVNGGNTLDDLSDLGGIFASLNEEEASGTFGMYEFPTYSDSEGWTNLPSLNVGVVGSEIFDTDSKSYNAVLAKEFTADNIFSVKTAELPAGAKVCLINTSYLLFGDIDTENDEDGFIYELVNKFDDILTFEMTAAQVKEALDAEEGAGTYDELYEEYCLDMELELAETLTEYGLPPISSVELTYDVGKGSYSGTVPTSEAYVLVVDAGGEDASECEFSKASVAGWNMSTEALLSGVTGTSFEPEESEQDFGYFCDITYPRSWEGTLGGAVSTDIVLVPGVADVTTVGTWAELQAAITAAEDGATIQLSESITAGEDDSYFYIPSGKNITIDLANHIINRNLNEPDDDGNIFVMQGGSTLTVKNGTLTGGYTSAGPENDQDTEYGTPGGAFNMVGASALTLDGVTVTGNHSTRDCGGAIYGNGIASLTIRNCTFSDNSVADEDAAGGAISVNDVQGEILIEHTSFINNAVNTTAVKNTGGNEGGAIYGHAVEKLTIRDCLFEGNSVTGHFADGGAICLEHAEQKTKITNSRFIGNTATNTVENMGSSGGAIYIGSSAPLELYGCTFDGNAASLSEEAWVESSASNSEGGALYVVASGLVIDDYEPEEGEPVHTVFKDNTAIEGGAVKVYNQTPDAMSVKINNAVFTGNTGFMGAALETFACDDVQLTSCTFRENIKDPTLSPDGMYLLTIYAASILSFEDSGVELDSCTIQDNILDENNNSVVISNIITETLTEMKPLTIKDGEISDNGAVFYLYGCYNGVKLKGTPQIYDGEYGLCSAVLALWGSSELLDGLVPSFDLSDFDSEGHIDFNFTLKDLTLELSGAMAMGALPELICDLITGDIVENDPRFSLNGDLGGFGFGPVYDADNKKILAAYNSGPEAQLDEVNEEFILEDDQTSELPEAEKSYQWNCYEKIVFPAEEENVMTRISAGITSAAVKMGVPYTEELVLELMGDMFVGLFGGNDLTSYDPDQKCWKGARNIPYNPYDPNPLGGDMGPAIAVDSKGSVSVDIGGMENTFTPYLISGMDLMSEPNNCISGVKGDGNTWTFDVPDAGAYFLVIKPANTASSADYTFSNVMLEGYTPMPMLGANEDSLSLSCLGYDQDFMCEVSYPVEWNGNMPALTLNSSVVTTPSPEGIVVARNIDTEAEYDTLAVALESANVNETVILLTDLTGDDAVDSVVVGEGVTLDLNGYDLEADAVVAFGYVKDSGDTRGKLIVAKDQFVNEKTEGVSDENVMPVWETNGYKFYAVNTIKTAWSPVLGSGKNPTYHLRPESADISTILAKNGGVKVQIEIQYKRTGDTEYRTMNGEFLQKHVNTFLTGYNKSYALYVALSGTDNVTEIRTRTKLVSVESGFSIVSDWAVTPEVEEELPDPLYFTFAQGNTGEKATITFDDWGYPEDEILLQYSYDKKSWTDLDDPDSVEINEANPKVYFRAKQPIDGIFYNDIFSCTEDDVKLAVGGNIMSLLTPTNYWTFTEMTADNESCFGCLFQDMIALYSASDLLLPATTLARDCYCCMFYDCTNLVDSPKVLPATALTKSCYSAMFSGCVNLETTPELMGETLVDECYGDLFWNCAKVDSVVVHFTAWDNNANIESRIYDEKYTNATNNWLDGTVSGIVYGPASLAADAANHIPTGWTFSSQQD